MQTSTTVATISRGEAHFERVRQDIGLWLGPLAFVVVWWLPISGISEEAHRLAAIVSLVVVWWVTEPIPIPVTGLIGTVLAVVCGITGATEAFVPFASPTIFLFIGSFLIGQAVAVHGLDQRLAFGLLSLPIVRGSLWRIRLAMGLLTLGVSAWMSNTATTAMMIPVGLGVLTAAHVGGPGGHSRVATGFLLTTAYAASIGGIMTPVGSPPNLITLGLLDRLAGIRIDFLTWMLMMLPITTALGVAMFALGAMLYGRAPASGAALLQPSALQADPTPWSRGQLNCLVAFGLAVILWITPGVIGLLGLGASPLAGAVVSRLDEGAVAVTAACLLFLLPVDWPARRFTLTREQAAKIDWGTILLFGAGLSLGHLMFETGLAERVGLGLIAVSGADSLWAVTATSIALGIVVTEITSNTAATNMLVPVILTMCQVGGFPPVPPALGVCLGASVAFMLPISTPPNAIVYGTGRVPITEMLKFGVLLDAVAFVIILVGLRLLCPLFGLA